MYDREIVMDTLQKISKAIDMIMERASAEAIRMSCSALPTG